MSEGGQTAHGFWADTSGDEALQTYRTLLDVIDDGVFQLDAEHRFVAVNDVVVETFGFDREDLLGAHVSTLVDDAAVERLDDAFGQLSTASADEPVTVAVPAHRADGEHVPVEFRVNVLTDDGAYTGAVGVIRERPPEELESELGEIMDRISDGFFAVDEQWAFTHVNESAHELINPDGSELVGKNVWEEFPAATERKFKEYYERAMAEQVTVSFEEYYPEPLDSWFEVRAYPSETGLSVYFRDVTDRKKREERLEQYETIVETIDDGIYIVDGDGRFTMVNEAYAELTGYDRDELVGEHVSLVVDDETRAAAADLEAALREGETTTPVLEGEIQTASGDRIPAEAMFSLLPGSSDDERRIGVVRDITERKEHERELRESERRYRTIVEYIPNGLVTLFDDDLEYTLAAGQGFDYVDVDPEELVGKTFREVWDESVIDELEPAFQAVLAGEDYSVEISYAGREWLFHAAPVTDERGEVSGGMTMAQDITEQKARQRRLEQYETIVETMNDGIYVKGEDGHFTMVNEAYAELTGYDRDELVGAHASLVVDESAIDESRQRIETPSDSNPTMEAALETADGDSIPAEATFATVETDGERREVGVVRDISARKEYERRIEESERRYRTLVEHFPDGAVGLFDEDLAYTAVGGELLKGLDVDPEDRIGETIHDLHPPELADAVEPHFRSALEGDTSQFEVEYRGLYLSATTLPVGDRADGTQLGMLLVQDVTEQREMEQELRESEARFRMLAENLEEVVWMTGPDGDEFLYLNPAYEDVWGRDREELYHAPDRFLNHIHQDDRARIEAAFDALPEEDFDEEFRITRPDGEIRWIHARGNQVRDSDIEMARVIGIGQDITDRKEREKELERALGLLERTERVADVGGWEIDPETQDVYWSDYLFDLLEVDADEEPPLESALDMYHDDDRAAVEAAVEDALASGDPFDVEARIHTNSGGIRWLRLQGVPELEDGEVISLRGAAQNITDQKARERELEESNERLEQFAYAASHDLQEPLRMVSSYLSLIERRYEDVLDEDGQEFLHYAVDGADRMRKMIDALLAYSRVDTRGDPFEPVDLQSTMETVFTDYQMQIEETDATITTTDLPTVYGDESQLRQVFGNLISNALEYSGDEPPTVRVFAERDDDRWIVGVEDEGIGIDPEHTDRVFEVFQRLHTQEEHSGTGIGLALAQRIVERHDGDIWVESEPGEGSTFYCSLPLVEETNDKSS